MRRLAVGLLCACLGGSTSLGLAQQAQQTPTFRGGVSLITVDVSVLDHDGKPVPGLTPDDFIVKLNGQVQPVRTLTYEQIEGSTLPPGAANGTGAAAAQASNAVFTNDPRLFVMLVDDLSMTASRGKRMLFAAGRFVDHLLPSDIVGFSTTSATATLNPTLDHALIQTVLRRTAGEFVDPREIDSDSQVGIVEAVEIVNGNEGLMKQVISRNCFNGSMPTMAQMTNSPCVDAVQRKVRLVGGQARHTSSRQIQAILSMINAMRPAPGLKQLVIFSDGLALPQREGLSLAPVARAASAAGVQLSVLVEEPEGNAADRAGAVNRADDQALVAGIQSVADITGGNFFRVIGAPDRALERVAAASSAIYHLGVQAPADSAPGKDFALSARVTKPGLSVHANRHAVVPGAAGRHDH